MPGIDTLFLIFAMNGDNSLKDQGKIKIGYYDPHGLRSAVIPRLNVLFPLTNLHWKAKEPADLSPDDTPTSKQSSRPLRAITSLSVDLEEQKIEETSQQMHQIPGISSDPYVQLLFINCIDFDSYRNAVRPLIKDWLHKTVTSKRDPTGWLIIHYVPKGVKIKETTKFKMGLTEKIQYDFHNHCVTLNETVTESIKNILITRLKEELLNSFGERVSLYETEVLKLETKMDVPGWNFGRFFAMKEALASAFQNMSLYDDTLIQFDKLEDIFKKVINKPKSKNSDSTIVSFFTKIGFDHVPMNFIKQENISDLRKSILRNDVTLFEFKCFMFYCQVTALKNMAIVSASSSPSISAIHISDLLFRLIHFLTDINMFLKCSNKDPLMILDWNFILIDEFLVSTAAILPELTTPEIAKARGELLLMTRTSLLSIADQFKWYIPGHVIDVPIRPKSAKTPYEIKSELLYSYLSSEELLHSAFRRITGLALDEFRTAGLTRIVNSLIVDLALLDHKEGDYKNAAITLEKAPEMYNQENWSFISTNILLVYHDCLLKLQELQQKQQQDDNDSASEELPKNDYSKKLLVTELLLLSLLKNTPQKTNDYLPQVLKLSETTQLDYKLSDLFEFEILPYITYSEESKLYEIEIDIKNTMNSEFIYDQIVLEMTANDEDDDKIIFQPISKANKLINGSNKIILGTSQIIMGLFHLFKLTLITGKLSLFKHFTEDYLKLEKVCIYPSPMSLHSELRIPDVTILSMRCLTLDIFPGDEFTQFGKIEEGEVQFWSATEGLELLGRSITANVNDTEVNLDYDESETMTLKCKNVTLSPSESNTKYGELGKSKLTLSIPYTMSDPLKTELKLRTKITMSSNGKTQSLIFSTDIDISLDAAIIVQDIFKCSLFSKFNVSTADLVTPLRILSISLSDVEHYKISTNVGAIPSNNFNKTETEIHEEGSSCIVFPSQPASFAFKIEPKDGHVVSSDDYCSLVLHYSSLRKESICILSDLFSRILQKQSMMSYWLLLKPLIEDIRVDLTFFGMTGVLRLDRNNNNESKTGMGPEWLEILNHIRVKDRKIIASIIRNFLKQNIIYVADSNQNDFLILTDIIKYSKQELHISVPIPIVSINHHVEIKLPPESQFVVGEPITATLSIHSASKWKGYQLDNEEDIPKAKFQAFVQYSHDLWVISGKKQFVFTTGEPFKDLELILVPLKPGKLLLPNVTIKLVSEKQKTQLQENESTKQSSEAIDNEIVFETDNINGIQRVLVVAELNRVTFTF